MIDTSASPHNQQGEHAVIRIVNPTFGLSEFEEQPAESAGVRAPGLTLLSNAKPNATELLEGIAEALRGRIPGHVRLHAKNNPTTSAPGSLLHEVAKKGSFALVAIAD